MRQLQPIQIDENTIIYVEPTDDTEAPVVAPETGEVGRTAKGAMALKQMPKSFELIENTIKTYTKYTLKAFEDAAFAKVKKVSLEFGVNVSGVGGVPYIATGTAGCNIKVTVECDFSERSPETDNS
jgi:hypothetical protein